MTSPHDTYTSPLASRNASPAMLQLWSARHKFNTWRRIWLAIAEAQHEVTKDWPKPLVTREQVEELRAVVDRGITDAEIDRAGQLERELRHDVMSHVHCLGEQCPKARPIIHLGCTSQDVVCNADLLILDAATDQVIYKARRLVVALGEFSKQFASIPTLGFTHYQPAQPTTIGRRAAGWAHDLEFVEDALSRPLTAFSGKMYLRGIRGATGTQASYLHLFGSDSTLVDEFEGRFIGHIYPSAFLAERVGKSDAEIHADGIEWHETRIRRARSRGAECISAYESELHTYRGRSPRETSGDFWAGWATQCTFALVGQTYPRVVDSLLLGCLASIASVLHKIATDIRLLCNRKELDEPFETSQIGSSAMPYKRNPMRCERICGLTRFVMNLVGNAYDTAATQWLERTLDDSSNRRLSLPEAFLALDGALDLMHNVASGLIVHEAMVRRNLMAELPFLATENILMEAVKAGGDRQDLHERIRVHAQAAGMRVKQEGLDNDLIDRLRGDPAFASVHHLLTEDQLLDPMKYIGRSIEQTERFVKEVIEPLRERYKDDLANLDSSGPRV